MSKLIGQRVAKVIAASGYCSRRKAEELIIDGEVTVAGKLISSPAVFITDEAIKIAGKLLTQPEREKLWIYHKPKGVITTHSDPNGRPTMFEQMPKYLPRVISIGRLDINTEGLILLTNNGQLAHRLESPALGLIRSYRVRVFGKIDPERLKKLADGIVIEKIRYASILIEVERLGEHNSWLKVSLSEGKNREIKKVMEFCGLKVTRLIRVSFGQYKLGSLPVGQVREVAVPN